MPPLFSSPAFPSVKFIENGVLREETFVASWKTTFFDRKLLSFGEKRRFWTGNFCCSKKNGVFGQKTFVAWRKMAFLDRKLLSLGEKRRFWIGNFCRSGEIRVFLYFQDLASFHHKKNHGSRYLPWIYFFSALRSRGFEFKNSLISHLLHRVDEKFRQEAFDQASYNLIL